MAKKLTQTEWNYRVNTIHNNKYDYTKVNYVNTRTKVIIICPTHGEFEQRAGDHMLGAGCIKCGIAGVKNSLTSDTNSFTKKANVLHNNKYDYSKVDYKNSKTKVVIICPIHGEFEQNPNSHLNGYGCALCGLNTLSKTFSSNTEKFITKAKLVHNNKYNYDKVEYVNSKIKVLITCPTHGDFEQTPNNHLTGYGCQGCAESGFDKTKSAILYYLKVTTNDNQILYKIGITNGTINTRFSAKELNKIEVISLIEYVRGQEAYEEEQKILQQYKNQRYIGACVLESGNTELFTKDVLGLDQ